MKILMLGWELPPHNSGGLGVACLELSKSLHAKGANITFVLPYVADHTYDHMEVVSALPFDVTTIQKGGIAYDAAEYTYANGSTAWLDIHTQSNLFTSAIDSITSSTEYDVIHAHDWLTARAALRAKEMLGIPLILHMHSIESDRSGGHGKGHPLIREIEQLSLLLADKIVVVSNHTKKSIMREYGIPADKIDVVHNRYSPSMHIPEAGSNDYQYLELLKRQGYKVVASIGRLTIQKGVTHLLRAMQKVVTVEPKAILLVVGSGDQYRELLLLSAELGLSRNVLFTEFQRGKRYRDAYAVADVFVMPSVSEPFGLTPLEAISYNTPVIISKQSGIAEVLHNCFKVDYWDEKLLAEQILALIDHPPLNDEMIKNAKEELRHMHWDGAADDLFAIYRNHLAEVAA